MGGHAGALCIESFGYIMQAVSAPSSTVGAVAQTARHAPREIAAFRGDGETRLIAAAYRDPARAGELYVLPDGEAGQRRAWAKAQLRCMFDDCPSPELTTVSRATKRDGFTHFRGGGGHAPESLNHRQGKAVLAAWLRRQLGDAAVAVEQAVDTQRSRVADVMATLPSGARVAFEVQYAALSVEEWRARHDSYASQGVVDVWLWGHTRLRAPRSPWEARQCRLDDVQEAAREAGVPVFFLNPETEEVAIAVTEWEGVGAALSDARDADVMIRPLAQLRVSEEGLDSFVLRSLRAAARRRESDRAERVGREVEREAAARRAAETRAARELGERLAAEERASAERRRQRVAAAAARSAAPSSGALTCRTCGKPLAPTLARLGTHVGRCEPGWSPRRRWG